jgi:hypothetical protein
MSQNFGHRHFTCLGKPNPSLPSMKTCVSNPNTSTGSLERVHIALYFTTVSTVHLVKAVTLRLCRGLAIMCGKTATAFVVAIAVMAGAVCCRATNSGPAEPLIAARSIAEASIQPMIPSERASDFSTKRHLHAQPAHCCIDLMLYDHHYQA